MNLDELKTAWQEYDSRLAATEEINQKVIASMIRERSVSRVARIRRRYTEMLCLFLFYAVCLTGFFFGNPFDYTSIIQYLPLTGLTLGSILMVVFLFRARLAIQKVNVERHNLNEALEQIILVYVSYRKIFKYITSFVFLSAVLINLSFLPGIIANRGLWMAVLMMSVVYLTLFICFYYFYFKRKIHLKEGKEEKGLKADLEELKELKSQ